MKKNGVNVDAVSIQNEPDWWVSYSGCLYDPEDLVKLVKNYAYMLDRETYPNVKLISGESLGFTQNYTDPLMQDETCREQIDIVAGHLYGHAPLQYMNKSAVLPLKYGKEVWMTEHSVTDNIDHLPT
jgi:glucuronoarabinoxylan endo-1,4-beta-xylanase